MASMSFSRISSFKEPSLLPSPSLSESLFVLLRMLFLPWVVFDFMDFLLVPIPKILLKKEPRCSASAFFEDSLFGEFGFASFWGEPDFASFVGLFEFLEVGSLFSSSFRISRIFF
jgi:hypothetical protein